MSHGRFFWWIGVFKISELYPKKNFIETWNPKNIRKISEIFFFEIRYPKNIRKYFFIKDKQNLDDSSSNYGFLQIYIYIYIYKFALFLINKKGN